MWELIAQERNLSPNLRKVKMNPFFRSELYIAKVPTRTNNVNLDIDRSSRSLYVLFPEKTKISQLEPVAP